MNGFASIHAAAAEQPATRKAALVLHSLGAQDRRWMLRQLAVPQRELIQPLLDELALLGLPADRRLVDDVLRGDRSPRPSEPAIRLLERATAAEAAALLQGEPDALVGRLLSLRSWSWKEDFLSLLPPARRAAVVRVEASCAGLGDAAPELAAALIEELDARLQALPAQTVPARRLLARLRVTARWLGVARLHRRANVP